MTVIIPDAIEVEILTALLGVNHDLKLFTNDVTAGLTQPQRDALDNTDFTEATFTGYADVTLSSASWTITSGNPTTASYATQTFARTSTGTAQTVYGYYVLRVSDSELMWFEYFPGPVIVEFNGDQIQITPRLTMTDTQD
jgi:hypothetical protein